MPCCAMILAAFFPRLTLIIFWLTGYGGRAFDTVVWPVLGFLFMPYTACAYAIALNSFGGLKGIGLALLILGIFLDLGNHGGSGASLRRRRALAGRH